MDMSIDDEFAYQVYNLNDYDAELPSLPYSIEELPTVWLDYHWLAGNKCGERGFILFMGLLDSCGGMTSDLTNEELFVSLFIGVVLVVATEPSPSLLSPQ